MGKGLSLLKLNVNPPKLQDLSAVLNGLSHFQMPASVIQLNKEKCSQGLKE